MYDIMTISRDWLLSVLGYINTLYTPLSRLILRVYNKYTDFKYTVPYETVKQRGRNTQGQLIRVRFFNQLRFCISL